MCSCVRNRVMDEVVGKVWIVPAPIERELEDPSARYIELVTQGVYIGRNQTQIFGDERQAAQLFLNCLQESGARTRHPLPGLGRRSTCGNVPRGCESAEVIKPNDVDMIQKCTQSVDAPSITGRTKGIPIVDRVAPQLSLSAEIIRWNPGDEARPAMFVQQEKLRVRPNIAGIRGYKERQVADQAYAFGMRVFL